jgi:alanine dehydrogenase
MPGAVPHTSTVALANATFKYGNMIANLGLEEAVKKDAGLANGVNVYNHKCTNENVAKSLNLDYVDLFELI